MKRILGCGLLLALVSLPLIGAKNSHVFLLPSDIRVGDAQLPAGHCEVSWTEASGSQVQLTIRTEDKKTITVPARVLEGKQSAFGVQTFVANGVMYLAEFDTEHARFIVQDAPKDLK